MLAIADVEETLRTLSGERPIFHSEADFQHALAWSLRERFDDIGVRLEFPLPWEDGRAYADIWLRTPEGPVVLELKYWKRELRVTLADEQFMLRNQAAQDLGRYDFVKDLARIERLVSGEHARAGAVVAITNDQGYWRRGRRGTVDADFRLHEGRWLSGNLRWAPHTGGTRLGRDDALNVAGTHDVRWKPYSQMGEERAGEFRYLFIGIE